MKLLIKIINFVLYFKWTDCKHEELEPFDLIDWKCKKCKAWIKG